VAANVDSFLRNDKTILNVVVAVVEDVFVVVSYNEE
jgi:hypothetical protein